MSQAVYEADLVEYPDNLWSLVGLRKCVLKLNALTVNTDTDTSSHCSACHNHTDHDNGGAVIAELDRKIAYLALRYPKFNMQDSCLCAGRAIITEESSEK